MEQRTRRADFRPRAHPHPQRARAVGAGRAPRSGHRRSSTSRDVRRLVESLLPGRRASVAPTPTRSVRTSRGSTSIRLGLRDPDEVEASRDDVPGLAELFPAYRAARWPSAARSTSTSRSTAPSRCCSPTGRSAASMQRSCRHLLVDEFQDLTPAHVLLVRLLSLPDARRLRRRRRRPVHLRPRRRRPGVPHRLRARCSPAPATTPCTSTTAARSRSSTAPARCSATTAAASPSRSMPGPTSDDDRRRAARSVEHAPRRRRHVRWPRRCRAGSPTRRWTPSSIAVLARVNSLLLAPHVALHAAGVPIASVLRPDVLERTGLRAALAYLRIAAARRCDATPTTSSRSCAGRPAACRSGSPSASHRRATWTARRQLAGLADQVRGQGRPEGAAPRRRPARRRRRRPQPARPASPRGRPRRRRPGRGDEPARPHAAAARARATSTTSTACSAWPTCTPTAAGFEPWLREPCSSARPPRAASRCRRSTASRAGSGTASPCSASSDGIVPHRLAEDVEEERRVLHVAITRGRHRVAVLADRIAPRPVPRRAHRPGTPSAGAGSSRRAPATAGHEQAGAASHARRHGRRAQRHVRRCRTGAA